MARLKSANEEDIPFIEANTARKMPTKRQVVHGRKKTNSAVPCSPGPRQPLQRTPKAITGQQRRDKPGNKKGARNIMDHTFAQSR